MKLFKLTSAIVMFFACLTPVAALQTIEEVVASARSGISYVDNQYLQQRIKNNADLVLLDVRTQAEFAAGHLKGASWVERGVAEFKLVRTLRNADAEIIVYCKKGNRSGLVVKALRQAGYSNVKAHVGFDDWVKQGLPYHNRLGVAQMQSLHYLNAASESIDYFQAKQ